MSCPSYCSDNCSSESHSKVCHLPLTPSITICSTNMNSGEVFCFPSGCQDHTYFVDHCHESCSEPSSCQPANQDCNSFETSCYPPTGYYVPRPCQGTGYLPASSLISSSCAPAVYRPLSCVSSSCRPVGPLVNICQPVGSASSGCRPFTGLPSSNRPQGLLTSGCRPLGCVGFGPQTVHVVPSSLRPLQPVSSGCQPLTPVCITCRPSCYGQGGH